MSDIQPAAQPDAPVASGGSMFGWLTSVSATVGVVVTILGSIVALTQDFCQLPYLSEFCPTKTTTKSDPPPTTDSAGWEATVQKRVASLNVVKDPKLRDVNLVVWHQAPRTNPLVTDAIVGLRAAGFTVREEQTDLSNVVVEDRQPGMVWIKSTEDSKDMRERASQAVGLVVEAKLVKVSDLFIANLPASIKSAGEVQVDVF